MLRIAAGNDVSVRSLCAWLGNDDQIWTLDSMADSNPLINSIAVAVGVEKETWNRHYQSIVLQARIVLFTEESFRLMLSKTNWK